MNEPSHPSSSLVEFVPLMRSPATWTPAPVTLPPDIHPLPDDISAYVSASYAFPTMNIRIDEYGMKQFVYPYTLEEFVLNPPAPHKSHQERLTKLHEEYSNRVKYLKEREDEKVKRRREALRKVAPGYEPPDDDEGNEDNNGITSLSKGEESHRRSGILEPTRKSQSIAIPTISSIITEDKVEELPNDTKPRDVMDDLVEGLARMDELESRPAQ